MIKNFFIVTLIPFVCYSEAIGNFKQSYFIILIGNYLYAKRHTVTMFKQWSEMAGIR